MTSRDDGSQPGGSAGVYESVADAIGNTPLVRVSGVADVIAAREPVVVVRGGRVVAVEETRGLEDSHVEGSETTWTCS